MAQVLKLASQNAESETFLCRILRLCSPHSPQYIPQSLGGSGLDFNRFRWWKGMTYACVLHFYYLFLHCPYCFFCFYCHGKKCTHLLQ